MTPGARAAAAVELLDRILAGEPAERALTNWGRSNRYAGSGDRAAVRDLVFDALRKRRSAAALGGGLTGRGLVLGLARGQGQEHLFDGVGHAPPPPGPDEGPQEPSRAAALDVPDWLLADLEKSLGDQCDAVLEVMRHRAPVCLRVNLRKATPQSAQASLAAEGIETTLHPLASTALEVVTNARKVAQAEAYRTGLVELQDASSQAVVEMLPLDDGMAVLDLCAGGGGKTLAMAARASVRLFAHDIQPRRMADLPARADRAGVSVTLTDRPDHAAPYDLVLIDAPCSGSGSWRRDPEGKWLLTPDRLSQVCASQAALLQQAAKLVRPGGWIGYATCSLLRQENHDQVATFLEHSPEWQMRRERQFTPLDGGDGFYCAVLQRQA